MTRITLAGALCGALLLAACGGDDVAETDTAPQTQPAAPAGETSVDPATDDDMAQAEDAGAEPVQAASFDMPEIPALPALSAEQLGSDIATLASDEFGGRAPASSGGERTVDWLEEQYREIGLEPALGDSYRQPVPLVEITADPNNSFLNVETGDGSATTLAYGGEAVFWTKNVVEQTSFEDSEMVFVGFGIVAPEYGWNDYEGIDAEGKTVVMFINDPGYYLEDEDMFNGRAMTYYGRWTYKYEEAARQGADAAIIIHQTAPAAYGWGVVEGSWSGPQLDLERQNPDYRAALEGWITEDVATNLFELADLDMEKMKQAALSADFTPVDMGELTAFGQITNAINRNTSDNVAGILPGSTNPDEYVLYMAHWDHLGRTFAPVGGGSAGGDTISNGAVDNATGTAGILSIARSYAEAETPPERSLLFVAVTAEESGLLGSAYLADDPIVPLNQIVGGINIDALLPVPPTRDLIVIGYGASELENLLQAAADERSMYLRPDAQPENGYFYRSDHISLAKTGVPMLYADSGIDVVDGGTEMGIAMADDYTENRYHKPSDEYAEDWNLEGMIQTFEVLRDTGAYMAYSDIMPSWYDGNEFKALREEQLGAQ